MTTNIEYHCEQCKIIFSSAEEFLNHLTHINSIDANVRFTTRDTYMKKCKWKYFTEWFFSLDFSFYLALFSAAIMNVIFATHLGLHGIELFFESFLLGFLLNNLLRKKE